MQTTKYASRDLPLSSCFFLFSRGTKVPSALAIISDFVFANCILCEMYTYMHEKDKPKLLRGTKRQQKRTEKTVSTLHTELSHQSGFKHIYPN